MKKITYVLIVVNLLLCVFIVTDKMALKSLKDINYDMALKEKKLNEQLKYKTSIVDFLCDNFKFNISKSNFVLDENNDTIKIQDIFMNENMLILYFNSFGCNKCISAQIDYYKNLDLDEKNDFFLIFSNFTNKRDIEFFKEKNKIKDNIYSFVNVDSVFTSIRKPLFFIIDKELTISHLYIPEKLETKKTEDYFRKIKKEIF